MTGSGAASRPRHAPGSRQPRLEQRQPRRLQRLLRRQRDRRGRQELLQLRHPVEQLAHRQPRQRMREGDGRLRRRLAAGTLAQGRPGGQQHQERDRNLAQAALQLGRHRRESRDRAAALLRGYLRGRRRHPARRPRPHLRAPGPNGSDWLRPTRSTAFASSRSAPVVRPSRRASMFSRPARSTRATRSGC